MGIEKLGRRGSGRIEGIAGTPSRYATLGYQSREKSRVMEEKQGRKENGENLICKKKGNSREKKH